MRKLILLVALAVLAAALQVAPATADVGSDNVELVQNIKHTSATGGGGSDLEFADLRVPGANGQTRDMTIAAMGVYRTGLHLYDVTVPDAPALLSVYPCNITQGDVQLFTRADQPGRTYATYTSDTVGAASPCYEDAQALGQFDGDFSSTKEHGTFIIDVTNPRNPRTVSFVPHPQGSHNMTVHPSGLYLYNSNSDLITSTSPAIEITDIRDIRNPVRGKELPLVLRPGLGTESHDITFNADGTRAYSAALSHTAIIDTTDPLNPRIISTIYDPAINVVHQSDPVRIGFREFLIIEDEFAGAAGGDPCPSGGVHVYDITGDLEANPQKVGFWNIADVRHPGTDPSQGGPGTRRCTAHVFQIHEEEALMTIAFYNGGVRVVDISGLVGVALGNTGVAGMREVGFFRPTNADTWAVKAPVVDRDGVFHMYGNDQVRGMDVYRVDLTGGAEQAATGRDIWMDATAAAALPVAQVPSDYRMYCLLDGASAASAPLAVPGV
jgi:hypothetical protein